MLLIFTLDCLIVGTSTGGSVIKLLFFLIDFGIILGRFLFVWWRLHFLTAKPLSDIAIFFYSVKKVLHLNA
jgi:hypothetical protein